MGNFFRSVLEDVGSAVTGLHVDTLTIVTEPTLKTYIQGEVIDTTGMVVTASAEGLSGTVTNYVTVSPQIFDSTGTQTVTVSYGDATQTFNVTVYALESVDIISPPTKTTFYVGDTLDLTGISVRATANNGAYTKNVTNICTYNPSNGSVLTTEGSLTLTATYCGMSDTLALQVVTYRGISITTPPTTTEYIVGDTFSTSGMVVTADYGTYTEDVTSRCTFSPANGATLSTAGTITVTATYDGESATTTIENYTLDRIAVTTSPSKTSYYFYDYFDTSGIVVKAYANNDALVKTVTSQCTTTPANGADVGSSAGNKTCTVSFRSKITTFSYTITNTIYGAEWSGGSSPAWTRTDLASSFSAPSPAVNNGNGSSPFDNILPWSGMARETDSAAGTLVKIPKFYYKWTRTGSKMKLQISSVKLNGFYVSPAHASGRGTTSERDYVYVGAYHCSSTNYKSISGATPKVEITKATARTNIHNLGTKIWQWDFAMYWTICMLYLVEYASWDSQTKIGYGCGNGSGLENSGKCDSMTYHTGTNASSRTAYGFTRYRYIEGLWNSCRQWIDGIYFSGANIYIIKNPASFADASGGTNVGARAANSSSVEAFSWTLPTASGFEYAVFPDEGFSSSSWDTYSCDQIRSTDENGTFGAVLDQGATWANDKRQGLFGLMSNKATTTTNNAISCRLMKLP